MTATLRAPSTALQWFPHIAATESATLDMANSRQIALRIRLRNHYWLTECKPLGSTTVALQIKKMKMIDKKDTMTEAEVSEVLSDHYGFTSTDGGLTIPDLIEARLVAIGAAKAGRERAAAGGRAKAAKAAIADTVTETTSKDSNPEDF